MVGTPIRSFGLGYSTLSTFKASEPDGDPSLDPYGGPSPGSFMTLSAFTSVAFDCSEANTLIGMITVGSTALA
jgi:hypothetical protein